MFKSSHMAHIIMQCTLVMSKLSTDRRLTVIVDNVPWIAKMHNVHYATL
jgi:hypothetical protein